MMSRNSYYELSQKLLKKLATISYPKEFNRDFTSAITFPTQL